MTADLFTLTEAVDDVLTERLPAHLSIDQLRAQLRPPSRSSPPLKATDSTR
jgi:hypothetical protein